MSDSVGRIALDLGVNYNGFNKQLSGISRNATNMVGGAFKKLGGIIVGALAIDKAIISPAKAAMTVESSIGQITRTMQSNSAEFNKWAQTQAKGFGLARTEAFKYGSIYSNLISGFAKDTAETSKYTRELLEASAIVASRTGFSMENTMDRIRSGLLGNTEAIEDLGINVNISMIESTKAFQKFANGKSWQQLNFQTQQQIRLMAILEQSNTKYGDSLAGTTATKQMMFVATLKNIQLNLGQAFLPIYNAVLPALNSLANKIESITAIFAALMQSLFGWNTKVKETRGSANNLATSTNDVGKAAKKAGKDVKGALGGFDQLNTLTQAAASNASDAASGISDMGGMGDMSLGGNIDLGIDESKIAPLKTALDGLKTAAAGVKDYFVTNFGPPLQTAFQQMSVPLAGWKVAFTDVFTDFKGLGEPLKQWFVGDFTTQIKTGIGVMGTVLSGLLDSGLKVFNGIRTVAEPVINWFVVDGLPMISQFATEAYKLFETIFVNVKDIFDRFWSEGIQPGLTVVSNMITDVLGILKDFWDKWGTGIFDRLKEVVKNIHDTIVNLWEKLLQPVWSKMVTTMQNLWDDHLKGMVEQLMEFVGKLVTGVMDIYNKFISPLINFLIKQLAPGWNNTWNTIVDVFETVVGTIADVIKGLLKSLGGLIDFIAGVFTGDWKRAWQGIQDIFKGIFDGTVAIFKGAINLLIDGLNFFIGALNTIRFDFPDWVPAIGGKKFGINIPKIPKLANGGLVSAPTLAMVGDNRNAAVDPEVVSPLSKLQDMLNGSNADVVNAIYALMDTIKSLQTPVILKLGETELGRATINAINETQRQAGRTLLRV